MSLRSVVSLMNNWLVHMHRFGSFVFSLAARFEHILNGCKRGDTLFITYQSLSLFHSDDKQEER